MIVLGLNAYHGDASAALFADGELVAAIEEERLNRIKHSGGFPTLAVRACLAEAKLSLAAVDHVAVSRDPRAHVLRKGLYVAERAARSLLSADAERSAFFSSLAQRADNRKRLGQIETDLAAACESSGRPLRAQIHAVEHHRAHLASAFFASGFSEAAVLSLDGFGDFVSTMWGRGSDTKISVDGEVAFPHSLGVLYTAVCQWLGFLKYGDEGKVMGLAAYGTPRLLPRMRRLITLAADGRFALTLRYFRHHREGVDMTFLDGTPAVGRLYSPALVELLGAPRVPGAPIDELSADVAASLQALLEEAVLHIANGLSERTTQTRLCLAGGVALNSVANGRILDATPFRELFVQPAAGDNGTSLGAALWVMHQLLDQPRRFTMTHAYTGPQFDEAACAQAIQTVLGSAATPDGDLHIERLPEPELLERAVTAIESGAILGWFQGRMEFGPRALGHRSILCDPRRPEMKDILNRRIKHRESFRPFAPAILEEATPEWFERAAPSPAMLLVDRIHPRRQKEIPAVTHRDGTGRLQTVSAATSPQFYALIRAFAARTGVPVLLNTSFNEHEPIVCTPEDALRCFEKTHMDALALGPFFISRRQ